MYGIHRNDWMDRIGIRTYTWDAGIHNSKTGQKNVSKTICRNTFTTSHGIPTLLRNVLQNSAWEGRHANETENIHHDRAYRRCMEPAI
jgi:hypothetical protein